MAMAGALPVAVFAHWDLDVAVDVTLMGCAQQPGLMASQDLEQRFGHLLRPIRYVK